MLSEKEMELVMNADVILTKNAIMKKAWLMLDQLQDESVAYWQRVENERIRSLLVTGPKISKGENYLGLPYLVLDYPRNFEKDGVFAIRTMFWWGHFFSTTLQLSGKYQEVFAEVVAAAYEKLAIGNYYISMGEDPWEHHFEATNYREIGKLEKEHFRQIMGTHPFIKIASKLPLTEWPGAAKTLFKRFTELSELINQLPNR